MKQTIRYRILTIPKKISVDIRLVLNDTVSPEYRSNFDDGSNVSVRLSPFIGVNIIRPTERDEEGRSIRAPWNPNDSIGMTMFNLPIFIDNLHAIRESMKVPNLYSYVGKRLEINDKEAELARRVFTIGSTVVEFAPVVIESDENTRVEGIKVKFNNEDSSFLLTLNEMTSLYWNLSHMDPEGIAIKLYQMYVKQPDKKDTAQPTQKKYNTSVDIAPKAISFSDDELPF